MKVAETFNLYWTRRRTEEEKIDVEEGGRRGWGEKTEHTLWTWRIITVLFYLSQFLKLHNE